MSSYEQNFRLPITSVHELWKFLSLPVFFPGENESVRWTQLASCGEARPRLRANGARSCGRTLFASSPRDWAFPVSVSPLKAFRAEQLSWEEVRNESLSLLSDCSSTAAGLWEDTTHENRILFLSSQWTLLLALCYVDSEEETSRESWFQISFYVFKTLDMHCRRVCGKDNGDTICTRLCAFLYLSWLCSQTPFFIAGERFLGPLKHIFIVLSACFEVPFLIKMFIGGLLCCVSTLWSFTSLWVG